MENNSQEVFNQLRERARVPDQEYDIIRRHSARHCHDAVIFLPDQEKIVLAVRGQEPAKGYVWPFGGAQKIGYTIEDSLTMLIKRESGLDVSEPQWIEHPVDHIWTTGPKGWPVHDIGAYFTAIGTGELRPDRLHSVKLVGANDYTPDFRGGCAHWTQVGLDRAMDRFFGIKVADVTPLPKYYFDAQPVFD